MFSRKYLYITIVIACIVAAAVLFIAGSPRYSPSPTTTTLVTTTPTAITTPTSTPMAGVLVYSGSREHFLANYYYQALHIPSEGVVTKVYFVGDVTAKEILDWYKSNLVGYKVVAEYGITTISTPEGSIEWGAIVFKKRWGWNWDLGVWVSCGLLSTLGFIDLGAPFIGAHIIGLHPFGETPTHSSPSSSSGSQLWETPTSWL
ncbi:MAG: hypothetical protein QXY26_08985 [Ignisphaera sp.]